MNTHDTPPHVVIEKICSYYGIKPKDFKKNFMCRHACYFALNKQSYLVSSRIAELFNTTTSGVYSAIKKIESII